MGYVLYDCILWWLYVENKGELRKKKRKREWKKKESEKKRELRKIRKFVLRECYAWANPV